MEDFDYMEVDKNHEEAEMQRKKRKEQSRKKNTKAVIDVKINRGKLKLGGDPFPSPGNIQNTRLTTESIDTQQASMFLSTYNKVFKVKIRFPDDSQTTEWLSDDQLLEEKLTIQTPAEIQSIKFFKNKLGMVDCYGNVVISDVENTNSNPLQFKGTFRKGSESSWCGIDFNPKQDSQVAIGHMMEKSIGIFDNGSLKQQLLCAQHPTSFQYIQLSNANEPLIAVCEYNQLSVWDLRTANCVKRLQANPVNTLYCMSFSNDILSTSGAARNIYSFDCKKWSLIGTWVNCLKYEATFLSFSSVNHGLCYVGGMDSGLSTGEWKVNASGNTVHSFLGDSRWIGIQKYEQCEALAGFTETGHIYLLRYNEDQMREALLGKNKMAPTLSPNDLEKKKKHKQQ